MKQTNAFFALATALAFVAACDSDSHVASDDGGAPPSDATQIENTDASSVDPADEFDRWQRAIRGRWNAIECACHHRSYSFSTAGACVQGLAAPEYLWECENIENAREQTWNRPGFVCMYEAFEAFTECLEAAACDTVSEAACGTTYDAQERACLSREDIAVFNETSRRGAECVIDREVGRGDDTCGDPARFAGPGEALATGTTDGAGNHRAPPSPSCLSYGKGYYGAWGPDVTLGFTATTSGVYEFDTVGSAFDTVLYALLGELNECNTAEPVPLRCDDDGAANGASRITLALEAGQEIRLVVDGARTHEHGAYVLNVRVR